MASFGSAIRVLTTITAILMMSASKQAVTIGLDTFRELGEDGQSFWYRLPFTLLPALAKDSMAHRLCSDIFYLSMVLSLLGFQVVTIEMFLSTVRQTAISYTIFRSTVSALLLSISRANPPVIGSCALLSR